MKFHTTTVVLSTAVMFAMRLSENTVSANTPDLCTADIDNLRLMKPSKCDPTGRAGPDITVGTTVYNNDESHFVIGSPMMMMHHQKAKKQPKGSNASKRQPKGSKVSKKQRKGSKAGKMPNLLVYLPGTTDWPALSSCLLQSVSSVGVPTIGLTYGYLSRGDGYRNIRCDSLPTTEEKVECLTEQHNDAIYGGTYGAVREYDNAEFWAPVDPRDSIAGRLGLLLAKLDMEYPTEGWNHYYMAATDFYPDALPMPKWSKIAFMGHSQGAGHAAYLAQSKVVAGAVMVSGPQDECVTCPPDTKFWIDDDFKTKAVTAFAHGDPSETFLEPTLPIMEDNWERMAKSGTVSWSYPLEVVDTGAYGWYDACKTPIVSSIAPSKTSPCGRKGHCATALDDSSPVLADNSENNVYIYGLGIWASVADVGKC